MWELSHGCQLQIGLWLRPSWCCLLPCARKFHTMFPTQLGPQIQIKRWLEIGKNNLFWDVVWVNWASRAATALLLTAERTQSSGNCVSSFIRASVGWKFVRNLFTVIHLNTRIDTFLSTTLPIARALCVRTDYLFEEKESHLSLSSYSNCWLFRYGHMHRQQ